MLMSKFRVGLGHRWLVSREINQPLRLLLSLNCSSSPFITEEHRVLLTAQSLASSLNPVTFTYLDFVLFLPSYC